MRIIVPTAAGMLHPSVIPAVISRGYRVTVVPLAHPQGYGWMLSAELLIPGALAVVEHDVEVASDVLPEMAQCDHPWCCRPYPHDTVHECGPGSTNLLGCTKLALTMAQAVAVSDALTRHQPDWGRVDVVTTDAMRHIGLSPHVHDGTIVHHHGCTKLDCMSDRGPGATRV